MKQTVKPSWAPLTWLVTWHIQAFWFDGTELSYFLLWSLVNLTMATHKYTGLEYFFEEIFGIRQCSGHCSFQYWCQLSFAKHDLSTSCAAVFKCSFDGLINLNPHYSKDDRIFGGIKHEIHFSLWIRLYFTWDYCTVIGNYGVKKATRY